MSRGRPATPAQSKVIAGNFRKDRHSHGPKVPLGAPKCPVWLPKAAKKHWKEIAELLEQHGLVSMLDGGPLAAYCDSLGKFEEVTRRLASIEETLDETPQGYQVQSALFTVRNKLWEQVLKGAQEFGMTPAARSKVKDSGQQQLPLASDGWGDI